MKIFIGKVIAGESNILGLYQFSVNYKHVFEDVQKGEGKSCHTRLRNTLHVMTYYQIDVDLVAQ